MDFNAELKRKLQKRMQGVGVWQVEPDSFQPLTDKQIDEIDFPKLIEEFDPSKLAPELGMLLFTEKRRNCGICKSRTSYGYNGIPTHCGKHMLPGQTGGLSGKVCKACDKRRATFGIVNCDRPKVTHCISCKTSEMICINTKRYCAKKGCMEKGFFYHEDNKKIRYCFRHSAKSMIYN